MALAVIASAQPLDTYTCNTCDGRAVAFRIGDYSALPTLIIDPTCDCPFPNNFIPGSRLLPNGAWPEDIYNRNFRAFSGTEGRVVRAVARGLTPLHEALLSGSRNHPLGHLNPVVVERLLDGLSSEEVNARISNLGALNGFTPLHIAAYRGRRTAPGVIELLLARGADVLSRSDRGYTPLLEARSADTFVALQEAGADIRAQAANGFTALHRAAINGNPAIVKALLAAGLDPDAQLDDGYTPLLYAGSADAFVALQEAGANIRAETDWGAFTALHRAAIIGDAALLEALLVAGLDPNAQTSIGYTPLLYANTADAFETLLAGGANFDVIEALFAPDALDAVRRREIAGGVLQRAIRQAGRFATPSLVERLRAINPIFAEVPDTTGSRSIRYPLHYAAQYNEDPAMIAALSTTNVSATSDSYSLSPLHLAARYNGNPAVIQALLDEGAHIQIDEDYGWGRTPLYYASTNSSPKAVEIAKTLLAAGANVNARHLFPSALYAAAMTQNLAVMDMLMAAGAETVSATGSLYYHSLLADVLERGRFDCGYAPVAEALRTAGAESWVASEGQRMPYVPGPPVAECETVSVKVQELIDSGADLDALDSQGFTCLHLSAADGKAVDVTALATAGANVNAATRGGRLTPLHVAIWKRAGLATVRALIAAEADVNATDWIDQTALHRAARDSRADPAVVEALVAAGADVNARDSNWRMPLDYATRVDVNNEPVAELLRAAGGTCRSCDAP